MTPTSLALPGLHENFGVVDMSAIVQDASNKALLSCLHQALNDEQLLTEVAGRSHRHQLGFNKVVLLEDRAGRCVRLHSWESRPALEDVHSHCADFESRVVFGHLSEHAFEVVSGITHQRFRYYFDADEGQSIAVPEGIVGIRVCATQELAPNKIYRKRASDLHSISAASPGAMTVSVWGPRRHEALVLKARGADAQSCSASPGMPIGQLRDVLRVIEERLRSQ